MPFHNSDNNKSLSTILQVPLKSFYKGIVSHAVGNYIGYGSYFYWYELLKKYSNATQPRQTILPSVSAGFISLLVSNPFYVVSSRMAMSNVCFITPLSKDSWIVQISFTRKKD
jgi:hypothetical protein